MAFDANLYRTQLSSAHEIVEAGKPDGSADRLRAHGRILRAVSFGAGTGDSAKLGYIAGALADMCLAVQNHTTESRTTESRTTESRTAESLLAMADIFETRAKNGIGFHAHAFDIWTDAAAMLRQVATG